MPRLRRLTGKDVVSIFKSLGFEVVGQKGSHIKLIRISGNFQQQVMIVPNHKELDIGTIKGIYNQALRFVSELELYSLFYSG